MKQPKYNTALYMRLSRDDDNQGESNSIGTQRMILRRYAKQNGLNVIDEYIDDGYSGTNFDRPGFQRMITDIEAERINCVITKDLSRLGRNYLLSGQYLEMYFPSRNIRYIAIDNGIDSLNQQSSEFAPFLNIMNEWYARDISRKVTKAIHARFENGARYGAYAPLGYKKDPDKVGHLLIDEDTKWIIEKIFNLAMQGAGAAKIAKTLFAEQVPTASWFNYQRYGTFAHIYKDQPENKKFFWTIAQVKNILKDETYIGNSIHNKQSSVSFKCKKKIRKPKSEWWRVENTHEAIISRDVFEHVQQKIAIRRRQQKDGTTQIFAGLVKCADCGWSLGFSTRRQNKKPYSYFHCSRYSNSLQQCTMHYIRYDVLYATVLDRLQYWIHSAALNPDEVRHIISQTDKDEKYSRESRIEQEIERSKKRLATLDDLVAKIYEDQLSGSISVRNFKILSEKYQNEQTELESRIQTLSVHSDDSQERSCNLNKWINLLKKYTCPTELTAELLNALIEKILVHEAVKDEGGIREQKIEIFYRFVGKLD